MPAREIGYIIPHTHWDREWRYPIWENRMLLVEFMDELPGILDSDPDYRYFLMDGQCVIIEDYLEVRPHDAERVLRYIREGRIAIGPWYTLPDLYPIDGECLLCNLLKGIRLSQQYGRCMMIGYESFGGGRRRSSADLPRVRAWISWWWPSMCRKSARRKASSSGKGRTARACWPRGWASWRAPISF